MCPTSSDDEDCPAELIPGVLTRGSTLPDVYREGSLRAHVAEVFNCMRTRFLPGLLALLAEAGGLRATDC
jgi:hypothetical protein